MDGMLDLMAVFGSSVKSALLGFLRRIGQRGISFDAPIKATGYEEIKMKLGGFKPAYIILHHSFSADGTTKNWDAIRRYHMSYRYQGDSISADQYAKYVAEGKTHGLEKPDRDIGYQYGVENINGVITVLQGREVGDVGAHAIGFNDRSVGICLVGNYNLEPPSEGRLFAILDLCRELQIEFGIPRANVIGHRETYKLRGVPVEKTCPGSQFDLEEFRARLRD